MRTEKKLRVIKFQEIKERIISELKNRSKKIKITESVTLLDGFVNEPFGKELSDSFVIGGPTIPMIMLMGNESGQVYFFALKALLHDLEV